MTNYDITHNESDSAFMGRDNYIMTLVKRNKALSLLSELDELINDLEVYDLEVVGYEQNKTT